MNCKSTGYDFESLRRLHDFTLVSTLAATHKEQIDPVAKENGRELPNKVLP